MISFYRKFLQVERWKEVFWKSLRLYQQQQEHTNIKCENLFVSEREKSNKFILLECEKIRFRLTEQEKKDYLGLRSTKEQKCLFFCFCMCVCFVAVSRNKRNSVLFNTWNFKNGFCFTGYFVCNFHVLNVTVLKTNCQWQGWS